jgi:hypothetical protein
MNNRAEASRPLWRAPRSKLPAAKLRVAGGAEGDEEPITGSRGVFEHRVRPARGNPGPARAGYRTRNRRSKGRRKSSALLVDRRHPGPGNYDPFSRRSVGSGLGGPAESVSAPAKCAPRYRAVTATGVSEARSLVIVARRTRARGRKRPHGARTTRRSDQARREACRSPVPVGGIPSGTRPTKSR